MDFDPKRMKIANELFSPGLTKGQRRKLQIVEGAIRCYAELGLHKTTFDRIAERAGTSRHLILHFFKTKEEIFDHAVQYIRFNAQSIVVDRMAAVSGPEKQLEAYIRGNFDWIQKFPDQTQVWKLFFYLCGVEEKARKQNTELVHIGHQRTIALIREGVKEGVFRTDRIEEDARVIQLLITGGGMSYMTEKVPKKKAFVDQIVKRCMETVIA